MPLSDETTSVNGRNNSSDQISERLPSFPLLLQQFHLTCDSIRELAGQLKPHVANLDQDMLDKDLGKIVKQVGVGPKVMLRVLQSLRKTDRHGNVALHLTVDNLQSVLGDDTDTFFLLIPRVRGALSQRRGGLLNSSLLTSLVGGVEVLIAGVASQHFSLHPGDLHGEAKEFSLSDLEVFDTIADARETLIARRVDALMREGFDDWSAWFQKRGGLGFEQYVSNLDAVREIFQRRHIVVHNAGRVSQQYVAHVKDGDKLSIGEPLQVDETYLLAAADMLEILGTLLCVSAWAKWNKSEADLAMTQLANRVYDFVEAGNWFVVRQIASRSKNLGGREATQLTLWCNEQLAIKRTDGVAAIANAIRDWDTGALSRRFQFAQACLGDDLDTAYEIAAHWLAEDSRNATTGVTEWPMCQEFREDSRFASLDLDRMVPEGERQSPKTSGGAEQE